MTAAMQSTAPYTCTADEARALTAEIKGRADDLWRLMSKAYEIRAWAALSYPTWESYVRAEFGVGRSRSYQLLDQAKVVREIQAAADLSTPVDITEATARDLKPRLAEAAEQVREAVVGVPEPDRPAVVADVVRDAREQFVADRKTGEVLSPQDWAGTEAPGGGTSGTGAEPASVPSPGTQDGWSPSDALDKPLSKPAGPRPTPARPSVLDTFADAAADLRRATDRLERTSADPLFDGNAHTAAVRHRRTLDDAVEGLGIVLGRLPSAAGS